MRLSRDLTGRTALVTGATGVIGRRVCEQLRAAGAHLLVHYATAQQKAEALAGPKDRIIQAHLDRPEGISALAAEIGDGGGVDILVNTVHLGGGTGPVGELAVDVLRNHLESTVLHAQLIQAVLPAMRAAEWGRIVYVSGALMARPAPGMAAFGAAKAAASLLTRYTALEEGRAGITANVVAPGRVVDPEAPKELDAQWAQLAEELAKRTALGRFPTPDEVAAAVLDLVVPSAAGITGQTVWVTGGEPIA